MSCLCLEAVPNNAMSLSNLRLIKLACTGADTVAAGLATHLVPSEQLPELQKAICQLGERAFQPAAIAEAISRHQVGSLGPMYNVQGNSMLPDGRQRKAAYNTGFSLL